MRQGFQSCFLFRELEVCRNLEESHYDFRFVPAPIYDQGSFRFFPSLHAIDVSMSSMVLGVPTSRLMKLKSSLG